MFYLRIRPLSAQRLQASGATLSRALSQLGGASSPDGLPSSAASGEFAMMSWSGAAVSPYRPSREFRAQERLKLADKHPLKSLNANIPERRYSIAASERTTLIAIDLAA
jgi:hypothetical protein